MSPILSKRITVMVRVSELTLTMWHSRTLLSRGISGGVYKVAAWTVPLKVSMIAAVIRVRRKFMTAPFGMVCQELGSEGKPEWDRAVNPHEGESDRTARHGSHQQVPLLIIRVVNQLP
jgi:hypothetical protein